MHIFQFSPPFGTSTTVANHRGNWIRSLCPIFNSLSTSFSIISFYWGHKCRLFCFIGFTLSLMISLCTATSGLISTMSFDLQANKSTFFCKSRLNSSWMSGCSLLPSLMMCPGCSGSSSIFISSPSSNSAVSGSFFFLHWDSTSLSSSPRYSPDLLWDSELRIATTWHFRDTCWSPRTSPTPITLSFSSSTRNFIIRWAGEIMAAKRLNDGLPKITLHGECVSTSIKVIV